jgi:hypothetical protein
MPPSIVTAQHCSYAQHRPWLRESFSDKQAVGSHPRGGNLATNLKLPAQFIFTLSSVEPFANGALGGGITGRVFIRNQKLAQGRLAQAHARTL